MTQWIRRFDEPFQGSRDEARNVLGGKGAGLTEMTAIGVPVPPGFTIVTAACVSALGTQGAWPEGLEGELAKAMAHLEKATGKTFGDPANPLLVSVRSGARSSMPGMMDTVLNVGLNAAVVEGLGKLTGNPRFAQDCHRRFVHMFGDVVLGVKGADGARDPFEVLLDEFLKKRGVKSEQELDAAGLAELASAYRALVAKSCNTAFPDQPMEQLKLAVSAVFQSWNGARARTYRQAHNIPETWGTAVNIQTMVFGNLGDDSATGVCFTRNPATGEPGLFGEYLVNAQGEDVVAGIRTPAPMHESQGAGSLQARMPEVYRQVLDTAARLEGHFGDMQDIEFTVEKGRLFLLQTRNGKRTGLAALRIATDLVSEGKISEKDALKKVDPEHLTHLLAPVFDARAKADALDDGRVLGKGLPAGPGAASGLLCLTPAKAQQWRAAGKHVVLVRHETSPEDVGGMIASEGIVTLRGGMTSHAAVVARGMGKPCIVGAGTLSLDEEHGTLSGNGRTLKEGDAISLDGTAGEVLQGLLAVSPSPVLQALVENNAEAAKTEEAQRFTRFMGWVDGKARMSVRANAETPRDASVARALGARGIGLCRTEHMFFDKARIPHMREMILAKTPAEREKALAELLPWQRADFVQLYRIMDGFPVTIRLLDPPLHEFLPHEPAQVADLAKACNLSEDEVRARTESLREMNPMLGHRGCRLAVTFPEILRMQVRAIMEAACDAEEAGVKAIPEIMIPLTVSGVELAHLRKQVVEEAEKVLAARKRKVAYLVGTMIETPRAALDSKAVAHEAQFFSFGTNDLTQMTFGISRDDVASFLPSYLDQRILERDPFVSMDADGVGQLVQMACERGRSVKANLKLGVCGEHGGDPASIHFFHKTGLDYVSCSPYRVPTARLAAAQANL